ncbi:MAG: right-handed parallel beta-helix repeat-containing protein [Rikenellaceae bacterium]
MKKGILFILSLIAVALIISAFIGGDSQVKVVEIEPIEGVDMTQTIRQAIESVQEYDNVKLVLKGGEYRLSPDMSFEQYLAITNHGNGSKRIAFPFVDHESVEIVGEDAKLIFSGQIMPFFFERCRNVKISGVTIDWDTPFTFLAELTAVDSDRMWREVLPKGAKEGFSWRLKGGKIEFPNIDGFNYKELGSTLAFDPATKRPVVGALDYHSTPSRVEKVEGGKLRIYEKLKHVPPMGSLLSSKGNREDDRYAPAFEFKSSKNITIDSVTIHHALGMGFLFERSEDITITNSQIVLSEGSERVISSTADATHFASCRGEILIEGCRFENMLDDGTNVHGTYVEVVEVLDSNSLRVELQHFEQLGSVFAEAGDQVWYISSPSPTRAGVAIVKKVNIVNEKYIDITFESNISEQVKVGDVLENKTWNPEFTMRGCTIQNHRARSVVLKSPLKTVIEDNYFSSMMSGVLLRGETFFWYESGAVEDLLIRGNTFYNAADCGTKHAALYITPRLGEAFDSTVGYDRNIRFVDNKIVGSNPRVVIADRAVDLLIEGNSIEINDNYTAPFSNSELYELTNCQGVKICNNHYAGEPLNGSNEIKADKKSLETLTYRDNTFEAIP